MIEPLSDYVLVEVIVEDSITKTTQDAEDSWQKGTVVAASKYGTSDEEVPNEVLEPGDVIYWQKFAEDDTPPDFKKVNQVLIKFARIMAVERK